MSIYVQDFRQIPSGQETTPEVNVTESVTEYVVEVVLGHKGAIPELTQHHSHNLHFHKHLSFKAINEFAQYHLPDVQVSNASLPVDLQENYSYLYLQEINPPPPKA